MNTITGVADAISKLDYDSTNNWWNWYAPSPTPCYVPPPTHNITYPARGCVPSVTQPSYSTGGLIDALNALIPNNKNKGESEMFNMFNVVKNGQFRLDMNGRIAVKTQNGYKAYNVKKNRLVNCDNFVFDIGDECFFTVPTMNVKVGDIILVNDVPKCVIKTSDSTITVLNYESSVVEDILPERHVFMGNAYFYIKVVSMFGNKDSKKSSKKMVKWMLMSKLFKPNNSSGWSDISSFNPMTMMFMSEMMKNTDEETEGMFEGMFDFFEEDNEDDEADE